MGAGAGRPGPGSGSGRAGPAEGIRVRPRAPRRLRGTASEVREAPRAAERERGGARRGLPERWDERAAGLSLRVAEPGAGGYTVGRSYVVAPGR